ncbi:MAG: Uncharacterized protein Greene101447_397 [Parcubacteria group bacterium Greene1014_47]|nr:MAG: Uncharacterized protein Greene101447_397 [Parcubacteria group bacterium Greene1014_47]
MKIMHHSPSIVDSWFLLSLEEQMGNIGSEVGRTRNWQGEDAKLFWGSAERALELMDLTIEDERWKNTGRRREVAVARELFCSAATGDNQYKTSLEDLDNYFFQFALAARATHA